MNWIVDAINLALLEGVEHRSDHVVWVGPGSLKVKPPTATQVSSVLDFKEVNSGYSVRSYG